MTVNMAASPKSGRSIAVWIAALCLLLLCLTFREAEADLLASWQTEEYSHGFFIPLIALLIGGHRLAEARPAICPSWWGILWLSFAGILLIISRLSAFDMAAQYGLVIALAGISLACLGRSPTRVIAPALVYLIFAIPLPHLVLANLSQKLQLLSSSLGVWPLDALGIPVFQEGNVIDLGGFRLQVVDACSGLRYLFPLMSFGYLVVILLKDSFWKRAILFLSTIPISIGLNALRITIIGVTVDLWGQKMAEGFIHIFEGWAVFMVCLSLLMGETWVLLHIGKKRGHFRYNYISLPRGAFFSSYDNRRAPSIAALVGIAGLAFVFGTNQIAELPEVIPAHPSFASFPTHLGEWQGHQDRLTPEILTALKLSDYWLADYLYPQDPATVNLYIAYYNSQRVGVTTHSPSNCIPGGGWQITHSEVMPLTLADGTGLQVTRIVIRKDHEAALVYYWFDERGRDLTETYYAKWYLLWDSITMHRTDGALVRLVTPLAGENSETTGDQRLHLFLDQAYPVIKTFIPDAITGKSGIIP